MISGKIQDAETGLPLPAVSVVFYGTTLGTTTNNFGSFQLSGSGNYAEIFITALGYLPVRLEVEPKRRNGLLVRLKKSQTVLKEVAVSARARPYRNSGNPAVELIRQVIANKEANRAQHEAYLEFDRYERVGINLFNIPPLLVNNFLFRPYRFMLDTLNGKLSAQVYLSEKRFRQYMRREPAKTISILQKDKESNIVKFIDTAGVNIYINRLYGDKVDIYENNIFIANRQLLSPISDHSPDFYKFYITDTLRSGKDTLVELHFIPRNRGDLLFEGHLLVALNGRYAVTGCELYVDSRININFLHSLKIDLNFERQSNGRYFLVKSVAETDFGVLKNKGFRVKGERTIVYGNYQSGHPMDAAFYKGQTDQVLPDANRLPDSLLHRPDSLSAKDAAFYRHVAKLEHMRSFKRLSWVASALSGGYADTGPFQFNLADFLAYSSIEGLRPGVGGRTTPQFERKLYLEGYLGYGTKDRQLKYQAIVYYSFNQTPQYRYPNNFFKISSQYDIGLPGQSSGNRNFQTALSNSFQLATGQYYFYTRDYRLDYVKEFDNHFSFDLGFYNRVQKAAGTLTYTRNDGLQTPVNQITSSVATLSLRYAPHEQLFQGTNDRSTIKYKYPIFTLLMEKGLKGVLNSTDNYESFTATIEKRFYLSQLGVADMTLLGGLVLGKVPYPLLHISPANPSLVYEPTGYNLMQNLEFISDHYYGFNIDQSFNGFFLNKVPLVNHLKLREYLSFKILYGGLRSENNPAITNGLYNFPVPALGATGAFGLGSAPYIEAGFGIGNILKLLRVDAIRRFTYLDHPGVARYGIKLTVNIDL